MKKCKEKDKMACAPYDAGQNNSKKDEHLHHLPSPSWVCVGSRDENAEGEKNTCGVYSCENLTRMQRQTKK